MKNNALPLLLGAGALFFLATRKSSGGTKSDETTQNGGQREPLTATPSVSDLTAVPTQPTPENPIGPNTPMVMSVSRSRIG